MGWWVRNRNDATSQPTIAKLWLARILELRSCNCLCCAYPKSKMVHVLSKPRTQANPTSAAFHATSPPTSHHSSRCLLTRPRSPCVTSAVKVNRTELMIKLPKTTRAKRAGEGMRANDGEGAIAVKASLGSRTWEEGIARSFTDEILFLGAIASFSLSMASSKCRKSEVARSDEGKRQAWNAV